jgi:hypothetical protein
MVFQSNGTKLSIKCDCEPGRRGLEEVGSERGAETNDREEGIEKDEDRFTHDSLGTMELSEVRRCCSPPSCLLQHCYFLFSNLGSHNTNRPDGAAKDRNDVLRPQLRLEKAVTPQSCGNTRNDGDGAGGFLCSMRTWASTWACPGLLCDTWSCI